MERQFVEHRAQTAFLMLGWVLPPDLVTQLEPVLATQNERDLSATLGTMWKSREAEDKSHGVVSFEQKKFSAIAQGLDPAAHVAALAAAHGGSASEGAANAAAAASHRGSSSETTTTASSLTDGGSHGSGGGEDADSSAAAAAAAAAASAAASAAAAKAPPGMTPVEAVSLRNKYADLGTYVLQLCGERDSLTKSLVKRERDLEVRRAWDSRCVVTRRGEGGGGYYLCCVCFWLVTTSVHRCCCACSLLTPFLMRGLVCCLYLPSIPHAGVPLPPCRRKAAVGGGRGERRGRKGGGSRRGRRRRLCPRGFSQATQGRGHRRGRSEGGRRREGGGERAPGRSSSERGVHLSARTARCAADAAHWRRVGELGPAVSSVSWVLHLQRAGAFRSSPPPFTRTRSAVVIATVAAVVLLISAAAPFTRHNGDGEARPCADFRGCSVYMYCINYLVCLMFCGNGMCHSSMTINWG